MLPKYHCELNTIEVCWRKEIHKSACITIIIPALDSVSIDSICSYFRKVCHYNNVHILGGCSWGFGLRKVSEFLRLINLYFLFVCLFVVFSVCAFFLPFLVKFLLQMFKYMYF